MKKRFTESLINADIDRTHYEDRLTEVLWEYHKDLVELIERKRDNRTDTTELYKSVSDKLSKCISLNRTIIDISMDIAKQQLIQAFEKTGLTLGKEIKDGKERDWVWYRAYSGKSI